MKTKTGLLRIIEVSVCRDVWEPWAMAYKYEMNYQVLRMRERFHGWVVQYRWRLNGQDCWHYDFA